MNAALRRSGGMRSARALALLRLGFGLYFNRDGGI
jgi:hypothetical protein